MSNQICIISGSTMGTAEYVAASINDFLEEKGLDTILFHGPSIDELAEFNKFIIVSSTYGDGDVPDNLKPLIDALRMDINSKALPYNNIKLIVIGIGSKDYDRFANSADIIKEAFLIHNVEPINKELKKYDMSDFELDPEEDAPVYINNFINELVN